jgi:thiamine-phosphate pyrophosphorylase
MPPLILMTDDERLPDPIAAALALPRGSLVILRARDDAKRAELAERLSLIAKAQNLFLLIAADPALTARIHADGVHLPEARAHEAAHWRARFPGWFITCAAHDLRALHRPGTSHADAFLLSPVFATKSHEDAAYLGALRFRMAVQQTQLPVYALGGIDPCTARALNGADAAGLAAIGALSV